MELGSYPFGTANPFWLVSNFGLFEDNATKIHGTHEFQFGFHARYELIEKSSNSTAGPFDAGTLATSLYDTTSILKMIGTRYGLAPLAQRDAHANDLLNSLDLYGPAH